MIFKISIILFLSKQIFSNPIKLNQTSVLSKNPEEGLHFEGDIVGIQKGANLIPQNPWPNGIVPYVIDSAFTQEQKNTIESALRMVEQVTSVKGFYCIQFIPRTNQAEYINVINSNGCWSYVGKVVSNGAQTLSLQIPGCVHTGIVAHEFIHALGFLHEQSRPDRDDYISINFENIISGMEYNFNKYSTDQIDYLGMAYDYDSIMHYGSKAFSKNGQLTIVSKNPNAKIGQRETLSLMDITEIRTFYKCF
ncbi:unnamed protein product [Brachionus calyciflorus]|uniref:Metalloendopeptidase n=1 Tax=Brachionus calyciflorus TaxID=104777 RepID=A0A814DGJ9_9BILA|nr:unnamed protein product [Brachionus calyciflorus]